VNYAKTDRYSRDKRFILRFGGLPSENNKIDQRYNNASPCNFASDLQSPYVVMQGKQDKIVPFEQMDATVRDLVENQASFDLAYYPDEGHNFKQKCTWRDGLRRIIGFLDDNLVE